jgi:hypothetical protein
LHLASDYLHPIGGEARGKCRIRIFVPEAGDKDRDWAVIMCTELGPRENPGLSALHSTRRIAAEVMHLHRRVFRSTPVWIEQYPPESEGDEETFYLVVFDSHEVRESRAPYMGEAPLEIGAPTRKPLDRKSVQTLVGAAV